MCVDRAAENERKRRSISLLLVLSLSLILSFLRDLVWIWMYRETNLIVFLMLETQSYLVSCFVTKRSTILQTCSYSCRTPENLPESTKLFKFVFTRHSQVSRSQEKYFLHTSEFLEWSSVEDCAAIKHSIHLQSIIQEHFKVWKLPLLFSCRTEEMKYWSKKRRCISLNYFRHVAASIWLCNQTPKKSFKVCLRVTTILNMIQNCNRFHSSQVCGSVGVVSKNKPPTNKAILHSDSSYIFMFYQHV